MQLLAMVHVSGRGCVGTCEEASDEQRMVRDPDVEMNMQVVMSGEAQTVTHHVRLAAGFDPSPRPLLSLAQLLFPGVSVLE